MRDVRLKQVHLTLAFLRSVILSGEPMTKEVRDAINESIEHIRAVDSDCVNIKSEVLKGDYTNHFLDWKSRFFEYNPMVIEYEKRGTSERYTIKNLEKKYEIAMLQTPFN